MMLPPAGEESASGGPNSANLRRLLFILRCFTVAAAGMTVLLALLPAVGHDQLWCLYVGQRMLHGVKLYGPQILESNPPFIMWFSEGLAAISSGVSVSITVVFKFAVLIFTVGAALSSAAIVKHLTRLTRADRWTLGFAFVTIFGVMPARDFGQRDHLLAILCLPYVCAVALDLSLGRRFLGFRAGLGVGVAAGAGICLKPHHVLLPLFLETLLLVRSRSLRSLRRPELLGMIVAGFAGIAAVYRFTPGYVTEIVPLLRETYWAIGHLTFLELIGESIQLHILMLIVVALYLVRWTSQSAFHRAATVFLAAAVAGTLAYYAQGTGWYYQQLPALSFFGFALAFLVLDRFHGHPVALPGWLPGFAAGLSALAIFLTAHFLNYPFTEARSFPIDQPDPSFFAGLAPGTPVAILTTAVDDSVPPVMKYRLLWAQRTNNLWILPSILRSESPNGPLKHRIPPSTLAQLDRDQHRWMVEDLNRWHPRLILIDRCQDPAVQCQVLEDRHDDLLAWFERDPAFRAAFSRYRFLRSAGPYDAYVPN